MTLCSSKILHRLLKEDKQNTGILHPKILMKTRTIFILLQIWKKQDQDGGKQEEIIKNKNKVMVKVLLLLNTAPNVSSPSN